MNKYIVSEYYLKYVDIENGDYVPKYILMSCTATTEKPNNLIEESMKKDMVDKIEISVMDEEMKEIEKTTYEKKYKPIWSKKTVYRTEGYAWKDQQKNTLKFPKKNISESSTSKDESNRDKAD